MKHCLFRKLPEQRRKQRVTSRLFSPAFYRRKSRRRGFNESSFYKGRQRTESNPVANVLAGENSKSIALRGDGTIRNVPERMARVFAR
jgi:hypothetical protein